LTETRVHNAAATLSSAVSPTTSRRGACCAARYLAAWPLFGSGIPVRSASAFNIAEATIQPSAPPFTNVRNSGATPSASVHPIPSAPRRMSSRAQPHADLMHASCSGRTPADWPLAP
jgi:hypothetical protein